MNGGAYIMVVLGIILAKGLGFFRDIVFANRFGATEYTDMYFQIFGLVNLIFTGIGVALSTLVIKNLNKIDNSDDKQKKYVAQFITKTTGVIALCTVALYVFAKPVVRLLLPGLEATYMDTAVKLMYIMLPSFLFVIIAYIISGVLQNNRVFFVSSVMSLPFNCVIIASLMFKNVDIITVGIVTTIGWFLHIVVQLPSFYKKGYKLFAGKFDNFSIDGKNSELLYIFISNMMFQLCFMIDKAFVSGDSGAATTINYASNLFVTIASVFVVAMSNVVFPSISKNYEEGNIDYLRGLLQYIITVMSAIFIPFILTVCCFGKNIIELLYEHGEFSSDLTLSCAILFALYTLGAFGYVCQELLNKVLYLDSKYSYTVIGTIAVVALKWILNMVVVDRYGAVGVAATTALLFILYSINVFIALAKVTGSYADKPFLSDIFKIALGGGGAFIAFLLFKMLLPTFFEGKILFVLPLMLCGIVYIAFLILSKVAKKLIKRNE